MEALKPNSATLVSCAVEREGVCSSKHDMTNNAAMCSYKVMMLRFFDVVVCCSCTTLRAF